MVSISNDLLAITIDTKGAELKSILHLGNGLQYMWSGDQAYWSKTSPILFPIVGALRENRYTYRNNTYTLSRHGFARDLQFEIVDKGNDKVTFKTEATSETKKIYPFDYALSIIYQLDQDQLFVTYIVQNNGNDEMFFSIGGHPAFKLPLVAGTAYDDYQLAFEKTEDADRWLVSNQGLIENATEPLLDGTNVLPLKKELFLKDALVIKGLKSHWVEIKSTKTPHGLKFSFAGFPFLGLWAAPNADFLCIEPWRGIADSVLSDRQLAHKEGIIRLIPGENSMAQWVVQCY